jgi:hypothetical protein
MKSRFSTLENIVVYFMEDIMNYEQRIDNEREEILDKLVAAAQELNLGYD